MQELKDIVLQNYLLVLFLLKYRNVLVFLKKKKKIQIGTSFINSNIDLIQRYRHI